MATTRFLRNGKPALGVYDEGDKDGDEDDDDLDEHVSESIREASVSAVVDDETALAGKDLVCRTEDYNRAVDEAASSSDHMSRIKPLHVSDSMKKNVVAFIQRKRKQEAEAAEQRTAMKKKKEDAEEKVRNAKKDWELCDEEIKRLNQKIETMQKQHHEMTSHYKTSFNKLNEREKLHKQKAAEAAAARANAEARKNAEAQAAQVAQAQAAQISAAIEASRRASPFASPAAAAASLASKGFHLGGGQIDPNMLLQQLYAANAAAGRGNPLMNFPGMIPNTIPSTQP